MSKLILFAVFLFSATLTFAQSGTIRGTITDAKNKETLIGATVKLTGTQMGAATDINGFFSIAKVPAGKYTLEITYVSYKTETIKNVCVDP